MNRIFFIVDSSGSMSEMGKIHLERNLCRYAVQLQMVDQEKYADTDVRFYQSGQSVSEIVAQSDGDVPILVAEGSLSLDALADFLSQNLDDTQSPRALILSDGNFSNSDLSNFQKQLNSFPELIIRTVAIGADADLLKLTRLSTNNSVYLAENIASAIDCTIFSSNDHLTAPDSIDQILQAEPTEPEEDWGA